VLILERALTRSVCGGRFPWAKSDFNIKIPFKILLLPDAFFPIMADKSGCGLIDVFKHER
jgi:hypothetical protein